MVIVNLLITSKSVEISTIIKAIAVVQLSFIMRKDQIEIYQSVQGGFIYIYIYIYICFYSLQSILCSVQCVVVVYSMQCVCSMQLYNWFGQQQYKQVEQLNQEELKCKYTPAYNIQPQSYRLQYSSTRENLLILSFFFNFIKIPSTSNVTQLLSPKTNQPHITNSNW